MQAIKYFTFKKDVQSRYASQLNYLFSAMEVPVYIEKGDKLINPKNLISLLAAGFKAGEQVRVVVEGDEKNIENALWALSELT